MTATIAQEPTHRRRTVPRPPLAPNARHGTVYVARACGFRCTRCAELRHGRVGRYRAGCRCQPCLAAWEATLRFPFADLERLLLRTTGGSTVDVAARLGIGRRQVLRLRARPLNVHEADGLAIHAGFHPAEVWAGWCPNERA